MCFVKSDMFLSEYLFMEMFAVLFDLDVVDFFIVTFLFLKQKMAKVKLLLVFYYKKELLLW